jgi:type I restriction enzyme M protein
LLPFRYYEATSPNILNKSYVDVNSFPTEVNGRFDCIITNPPFSVTLDKDTSELVKNEFIFGDKKSSENLFIERYYQLLRENGRA